MVTENKSQSQILFRNRAQQRHILLYENYLIFCKLVGEAESPAERGGSEPKYQFKFSLAVANLSVAPRVKGEEKKLEVFSPGEGAEGDVYILEAAHVTAREDFSRELMISTGAGLRRERRITELQSDLSTLHSNSGNYKHNKHLKQQHNSQVLTAPGPGGLSSGDPSHWR